MDWRGKVVHDLYVKEVDVDLQGECKRTRGMGGGLGGRGMGLRG